MNDKANSVERVIGFDGHPDRFTAAILRGPCPPPLSEPATVSATGSCGRFDMRPI